MTIEELNELVTGSDFDEFIRVCEARQCKALGAIADQITGEGNKRLVLLAGGSSAGKTTTAKRLCTQLRVNGAVALHLSTDDYFKGCGHYPLNPDGTEDYEHVDCVDTDRLASDMMRLVQGETIPEHRFDFMTKQPCDTARKLSLPENGIIVLEGIHALNPKLTAGVPHEVKFRLYVDPKPTLEMFAFTRMSSRQARLVRRLVRDNQFRRTPPSKTFAMWPNVIAGEEKWILPFVDRANATFDSSLDYELAVLKPYAMGLLERARAQGDRSVLLEQMHDLLSVIVAASPNGVPGDSILRETIGGSLFSY